MRISEVGKNMFVDSNDFGMANLWKSETGLPFNVWIEEPSEGVKFSNDKRRVKFGISTSPFECISVSYWDKPEFKIRAGSVRQVSGMIDEDVTKLRQWFVLNYDLLTLLADGKISGGEFRNKMKKYQL